LSVHGPLLALELGGSSIVDFTFPSRGVLLLGSEELGLSQPALTLAGTNRISIPMKGIKASLNVAVAFGIAAQAWIGSKLGACASRASVFTLTPTRSGVTLTRLT